MSRSAAALATLVAATLPAGSRVAFADQTQLGAFFGPRLFSDDSALGYITDAPAHPTLDNSIQFGMRVARPFFAWLVPEIEFAVSSTDTTAVSGADSVSVFWMDPRIQLRFELLPGKRFLPFIVVGGGAPIALSSARMTFDSGIVGDGYFGGGMRYDTFKGFVFRLDARVSLMPGVQRAITPEVDIGFGVELQLGKASNRQLGKETVVVAPSDKDGDKLVDTADKCPDRAEDFDNFEDDDGCPDIDNDNDRVLDIADKCAAVAETYNGFQDDDGCPDTLPAEVEGLRGTVEGLLYGEGETVVRASANASIERIAKTMTAHPSIRVQLIGHTDNVEAKQFAAKGSKPSPEDLAQLAGDLSRARAEAVKQAIIAAGIPAQRVEVDGRGAEDPVSENDNPRGRLANRRVEIKLYVPLR